jgi:Spy/CpxP family protein refolding chaperone
LIFRKQLSLKKSKNMKTSNAIKSVAACALITWATAGSAQHTGHGTTPPTVPSASAASPYAGEQSRDIKALSAAEVKGLQSGAGMGYAKAAELNGYPGPMHVLELGSQLQLTPDQRTATEQLLSTHKSKARALGAQLMDAELALDAAFSRKQVDAQKVGELTQRIGSLQAALRAEHLQTHLVQTSLLSGQQIAQYQSLRGYDTPARLSPSASH